MTDVAAPPAIVVMGVAGSGKTTVGAMLAERLAWDFRDADSFHPPANIEKMRAGRPLSDADRWPWLDAIAAWIEERRRNGAHGVVTCSALKRAYRDRLRDGRADIRFVHLDGDIALISARMAKRRRHFMPVSLLESQFAALERPVDEPDALILPVDRPPEAIVEAVLAGLRL